MSLIIKVNPLPGSVIEGRDYINELIIVLQSISDDDLSSPDLLLDGENTEVSIEWQN